MFLKFIVPLLLFVAVLAAFSQTSVGEGMFEFNAKANAEKVLNEARAIDEAAKAYAANSEKGEVDFGDVTQGEDLFMYLKDKKYIPERVGGESNFVEEWLLSEEGDEIMGVVKTEKICKYINENQHKRSMDLPTPECGTEEAEGLSCCFEPADEG